MKLCIESISSWYSELQVEKAKYEPGTEGNESIQDLPKLEFVSAMQRRRLTPFAKIALFATENALKSSLNTNIEDIPIVFSSRHGDLHKTSELLGDLAEDTVLSPTAFGLSVHNAVAGLLSIIKNNTAAINAVSSGKDSFFMALVDAYARLSSGLCKKILFIHVDRALPNLYDCFRDELQIDHAVAFIVSLEGSDGSQQIEFGFDSKDSSLTENDELPAAICFEQWLSSSSNEFSICSILFRKKALSGALFLYDLETS